MPDARSRQAPFWVHVNGGGLTFTDCLAAGNFCFTVHLPNSPRHLDELEDQLCAAADVVHTYRWQMLDLWAAACAAEHRVPVRPQGGLIARRGKRVGTLNLDDAALERLTSPAHVDAVTEEVET
jgi:hypothetical protein